MSEAPRENLLGTRRFSPFFWTQTLGAFNDNVFKNALVILVSFGIAGLSQDQINLTVNLAAGLFILPFFLLSALSGQLADMRDKARIIRIVKACEIAIMVVGGAGLVSRDLFHGIRSRFQVRYVRDEYRSGFADLRIALGLEVPFGRSTERTIVTDAPEPKVVEVIKEVPKPFIDSDGDTVADELDKCPDTPRGLKVDAEGCIIPDQIIELKGVTFEFNKARLTPNAEAVLDTVVKAFVGQPSLRVEIGGHTDSKGSDAYNQKLSQARASSARSYLISQGARPDQLTAVGYGESQMLIKPETSEDDCELNRRIEFKVLGAN